MTSIHHQITTEGLISYRARARRQEGPRTRRRLRLACCCACSASSLRQRSCADSAVPAVSGRPSTDEATDCLVPGRRAADADAPDGARAGLRGPAGDAPREARVGEAEPAPDARASGEPAPREAEGEAARRAAAASCEGARWRPGGMNSWWVPRSTFARSTSASTARRDAFAHVRRVRLVRGEGHGVSD